MVRARVVGARPMDGLAVLSLRPSVVESGVASYADVKPGAIIKGTVASVEDYGVFVVLTPSVKRAPSRIACTPHVEACCAAGKTVLCAVMMCFRGMSSPPGALHAVRRINKLHP